MVHLLRLALFAVFSLLATSAIALLNPVPVYEWSIADTTGHPSAAAACASQGLTVSNFVSEVMGYCKNSDGANVAVIVRNTLPSACPSNSTAVTGGCQCSAGYEEKDGQCRPVNPCPEGQVEQGGACVPENCKPNEIRVAGVCVPEPPCPPGETRVNGVCKKNGCEAGKTIDEYETNGDATTFYCEPYGGKNCMVRVNPSVCISADGQTSCWGAGRMTGATCTPGSTSPGGDGPGNGPGDGPGDGPGGNGPKPGDGDNDGPGTGPTTPPVNPPPPVPPDPNTGKCPTGTSRYPDGNCYAPTPPPTDPDGDGKCPAGTVKVGTSCVSPSPPGKPVPDTGTPSNPNPGGGGDGDGDGDGDSVFSGSCMGGFVCEGDAIQCAIAREQHRRMCQIMDDKTTPEYLLYESEKLKDGKGKVTGELEGNREVDVSTIINSTDVFLGGGASCPSDPTITLHNGATFVIPYSSLCPYFVILGNILVIISSMSAVLILIRRI